MVEREERSAAAGGARELREETGYEGENARTLGKIFPNPAIQSNTCYTVLIENCRRKHALDSDDGADIITPLVPAADAPPLVPQAQIPHSLVALALYSS